eukprot:134449-Rhodomonas_salina.2
MALLAWAQNVHLDKAISLTFQSCFSFVFVFVVVVVVVVVAAAAAAAVVVVVVVVVVAVLVLTLWLNACGPTGQSRRALARALRRCQRQGPLGSVPHRPIPCPNLTCRLPLLSPYACATPSPVLALRALCPGGYRLGRVGPVLDAAFGADVTVRSGPGGTPLKDAVVSCNAIVAQLLRNKGGELPAGVGSNEFCAGASNGDVSRLRMLHSCGVDPDEGDYDARAPLHLACVEARCATSRHGRCKACKTWDARQRQACEDSEKRGVCVRGPWVTACGVLGCWSCRFCSESARRSTSRIGGVRRRLMVRRIRCQRPHIQPVSPDPTHMMPDPTRKTSESESRERGVCGVCVCDREAARASEPASEREISV